MKGFTVEHINHDKTGLLSPIIKEYLVETSKAVELSHFSFDEKGLSEAMKWRRNFDKRPLLVSRLKVQNECLDLSELSKKNINALLEPNTFTVTTGHQLCLLTGPLYFVHKILSTIKLCRKLELEHPESVFVPIYWMASEDHDLAEVDHLYAFGKKFHWDTGQNGAVGRMRLKEIDVLLNEVENYLGTNDHGLDIGRAIRSSYSEDKDLASATRQFVNELFGKYGVVIIDGDDAEFKRSFIPVMEKEMAERASFEAINNTIEASDWTFKTQVNPRPINLFYLKEGSRERIDLIENEKAQIGADMVEISSLIDELKEHPERFSPNVVLRPVYQEFILPNIAYVGGAGELAYWLEFKTAFEGFEMKMPVLVLRDHAIWLNRKDAKRIKKAGLAPIDLFRDQDELITEKVASESESGIFLNDEAKELKDLFDRISKKATDLEFTLHRSAGAEEARVTKSIARLQKKMVRAAKRKSGELIEKLNAIHSSVFPQGTLQERHINLLELYMDYGPEMFDVALENMDALNKKFLVLSEKDQ